MFTLGLRDREGVLIAVKLHLAWVLGFFIMIYLPVPYTPVIVMIALAAITATLSAKLCNMKDSLKFRVPGTINIAFPPNRKALRFFLFVDVAAFSILFLPAMHAILLVRGHGQPAQGMGALLIFYLLGQGFAIHLVHHCVRYCVQLRHQTAR